MYNADVLGTGRDRTLGNTACAVRARLPGDSERAHINTHSDVEGGHQSVGSTPMLGVHKAFDTYKTNRASAAHFEGQGTR